MENARNNSYVNVVGGLRKPEKAKSVYVCKNDKVW